MQGFILCIGLIGAALMLQGCDNNQALVKNSTDVKNAIAATVAADCLKTVKAACDAVVGEKSAPDLKKVAVEGKAICAGYGVGTLWANPTKFSACEAKLAPLKTPKGTAAFVGAWKKRLQSCSHNSHMP
jgi:hypothetical protein